MRRLSQDSREDSAAMQKRRRDQGIWRHFVRLTSEGRQKLNDECTLQRLVVSSAVYDSLARKHRGAGVVGLGQSKGIIDNVSLKFTVSQEVYLALFQTFGSSRRLQTRGKGPVPNGFKGEFFGL